MEKQQKEKIGGLNMVGSTWFQVIGVIILAFIMLFTAFKVKKMSNKGFAWSIICSFIIYTLLFGRLV